MAGLFPEDSLPPHTFSRGAKVVEATGQHCLGQLDRFSRVSEWAKDFAGILVGGKWASARYKLKWHFMGTKYNRIYLQLKSKQLKSKQGEFTSLPTPRTTDVEGGKVKNAQYKNGNYFRQNSEGIRWTIKLRDIIENGLLFTQEKAGPDDNLKLNPAFVAEMMGFPPDWTEKPFKK